MTVADLDILYMPKDLKQEFCLNLLEQVGASKISVREHRDEIVHCCVAPWHNETHPSASLNGDRLGRHNHPVHDCSSSHAAQGAPRSAPYETQV